MTSLFEPLALRDLTLSNRILMAPMCQYQCEGLDGVPTEWHLVHYGARACGGFGLIIAEATGVLPEGRITPWCTGLWNQAQVEAWRRVTDFAHNQNTPIGVQLNHAGRKASTYRGFSASGTGSVPLEEGGWETIGPSAIASSGLATPRQATEADLAEVIEGFAKAATRADEAGFDVIELHAAHGYLLHQFLSPLSNRRKDHWGGDLTGRSRLLLAVVDAVRGVWPAEKPLFVRISATEWVEGGFDVAEATELSGLLAGHGVDVIHVSSGGNVTARIPVGPGYQVPLAAAVRSAGLPVAAVGVITEPEQAEEILLEGSADLIAVARAALREPSWALRAASVLGVDVEWPPSYARAHWPRR